MYTGKEFKFNILWHFARIILFKTFLLSSAIVIVYKFGSCDFIGIPFLPIATIGTAVAFYVGFKNNQAYDRLWEARRLWGGIVNASRNLGMTMLGVIEDKSIAKEFLPSYSLCEYFKASTPQNYPMGYKQRNQSPNLWWRDG